MEDKWFLYLTVVLVILVVTSSMGIYPSGSTRLAYLRSAAPGQSFSALSDPINLHAASFKAQGH